MKMKDNNNQFLKYLENQDTQILCDIDYLHELISLVEAEFEHTNINTEEKLDILQGMLRDREIDYKEVKHLIEKMRNERKIEKKMSNKEKIRLLKHWLEKCEMNERKDN